MKFSFILCTINRNDEIIKSINSILNQTYQNFEIIIIDQNEHKNEQLENIDKRIIYKHVNFKGLSSARNEALKYATGDYCCIMDDDALYDSYNLEVANKLLMRNLYTVLSGIIVGMLGSFEPTVKLVATCAYINGLAGEIAEEKYTDIAMRAHDTIECIPKAIKTIRKA